VAAEKVAFRHLNDVCVCVCVCVAHLPRQISIRDMMRGRRVNTAALALPPHARSLCLFHSYICTHKESARSIQTRPLTKPFRFIGWNKGEKAKSIRVRTKRDQQERANCLGPENAPKQSQPLVSKPDDYVIGVPHVCGEGVIIFEIVGL